MIKCIVFDLDGTLVKSRETIYKTTIKALEELNLSTAIDKNQFYNLLGHHFADIFAECKIEVPDIEHFIDVYKGYYFDFIDSSALYDNTFTLLEYLNKENIKTGLLTTKGHDQAEKISSHFGLDEYLDVIEGRKRRIPIKPAPDQFLDICEKVNINPSESLMVGDTELDILCGKNAGAQTCAVSYGYRKNEEIKKLNPDYFIDNLSEIIGLL
jgi:phosphoglycolate phosphatase-like HAD superfamily hydrolase